MLTKQQQAALKAKHAAERRRDESAKAQKRRAKAERARRIRAAEYQQEKANRAARESGRLSAFQAPLPPGGIHAFRSAKSMPGAPQNKALDGPAEDKAWPLKMRPHVYLKLHPKGQHADLAREILGR